MTFWVFPPGTCVIDSVVADLPSAACVLLDVTKSWPFIFTTPLTWKASTRLMAIVSPDDLPFNSTGTSVPSIGESTVRVAAGWSPIAGICYVRRSPPLQHGSTVSVMPIPAESVLAQLPTASCAFAAPASPM